MLYGPILFHYGAGQCEQSLLFRQGFYFYPFQPEEWRIRIQVFSRVRFRFEHADAGPNHFNPILTLKYFIGISEGGGQIKPRQKYFFLIEALDIFHY